MKAVLYARVSSIAQAEEEKVSIPEQVARIKDYCQSKGYELIDQYIDEGYSGAKSQRPEFQRMLKDARAKKFDVIVAWKADRLSRGMYPAAALMEVIEPLEVKLEAVEEHLDMNYFAMLAVVGKMEIDNIKARTMMGKRGGAKAGRLSTGGPKLFGYDVVDGKRVINKAEAEIIEAIFDKLANKGYTQYRVALELNNALVPSSKGGRWSNNTIHRIVYNTSYKGETYAFKYKVIEPKHPQKEMRRYSKTTHIFRDKKDWIEVPNFTPAIVSAEIFEAAHKQVSLNKQESPRNRKHDYLFTNGRLKCGTCGRSMVGSAKKKANGYRLFYRCICNVKADYYQRCPQRSIGADAVEPAVWDEISRKLRNPDLILEELKSQRGENNTITLQAEEILLNKNIRSLRDEEKRYLRKYGQGLFTDEELDSEVERVRESRQEQEKQLAELKWQREQIQEADITFKKLSDVIGLVSDNLETADYAVKQEILGILKIRLTLEQDGTIQGNGAIPAEVQLSHANSPPSTTAPPGMTPPCWKR
jgi:site-specific DNA recombinase